MPVPPSVIACLDESSYGPAVCDYAAWLAGPMEVPVALLHVREYGKPAGAGSRLVEEASQRLLDQGVEHTRLPGVEGSFADTALSLSKEGHLLVLGKRGAHAADDRQVLGSNVDTVVRGAVRPVFLVSNLFLPTSRTLVLLDADPEHRRTVEFVQGQPWLSELDLDLMVMTDGRDGQAKLDWAREMLKALSADVFPMPVGGPHEALARYRANQAVDLLILSREIALSGGTEPLHRIEADSLWAWRAPVLVC
jgi:nucleotide-binding universal stress UspA family protein